MSQELFFRKRCKRLGYALGLSCFLNVSLLAFGLYEWQEAGFSFLATSSFRPQKSKLYRQSGKELATLTQSLRELETLDYDSLVMALADDAQVAEGYKKQHLSLSVLAHKHHFDVQRALGAEVPVRRLFRYMSQNDESSEIVLYPDLSAQQFTSVLEFAKAEKWPFTPEGLLARYKVDQDPELKEAFLQTDDYRCVELLLLRKTQVSKEAVFDFITSIDYALIKNLHHEMLKAQDFSAEVRRGFLLSAMPESAEMLFKTDPRFCVHSLTDKQAEMLLEALAKSPDSAQKYAIALLEGPRSKVVWNKAISVLCQQLELDSQVETRHQLLERFGRIKPQIAQAATKSEVKPALVPQPIKPAAAKPVLAKELPAKALPNNQKTAAKPSIKPLASKPLAAKPTGSPKAIATAKPQVKPQNYEIVHVVQAGDTLWHLSKRYGVDIEKIKKHNKLTSDALKPGSTLRIPKN